MGRTRWRIVAGIAAVAVVSVAVAVALVLTSGSERGSTQASAAGQTSHTVYMKLWLGTVIGSGKRGVLSRWPKPYQRYVDNFQDQCYEWWDKPVYLYNLCFKNGVLATKDVL